jgi:uncharacterized protein YdaU (DUF1376 family)
MHYYQFNIADYRKDTTHLTPIEHFIYRSLIDWYYLDEKPIPKRTQSVMRRLGLGSELVDSLKNVLEDFFVLEDEGYTHARIEQELAKYKERADIARVNGSKGGRPKKPNRKPKKTKSVNLANPEETGSKANQEPITNNQDIHMSTDKSADDMFDDFWNVYPKKEAKIKAQQAWRKLSKTKKEKAINDARNRFNGTERQYIPLPASYINAERWEDEQQNKNNDPFAGAI